MFQFIYFLIFIAFSFNVCQCFEDAWYSFHNELKDANREELVVRNVTTDENFKLEYKVKKWTSLPVGPICYSVGLMEKGIVLLVSSLSIDRNNFNITPHVKDFDKKPLDVVLVKIRKRGHMEIVVIMSFYEERKLSWYKISEEGSMDFIWDMPLEQPIIYANVFQMKEKNVLLLASNSSTVNLYQFKWTGTTPHYWMLQPLQLSSPVEYSIVNSFEYDYYLSIPQRSINTLLIFKFEDNQFLPYKNLTSKKINSITSFEIGFKSFLAIDGLNAGIYQFTRNGLVKENIINSHLEGISYWLPVPVTTYRDEVILFAQRILDHTSHKTIVIDIITYNGGKFEEHEDITCSHFGETQESLACLTLGTGITGSSYIAVDDKLALIVPETPDISHLFIVYSTITQMPNPKNEEIEEIIRMKKNLQKIILDQSKEYEELKNLYAQSETVDVPDSPKQKESLNATLLGESQRRDLFHLHEKLEDIELKINEVKEKVKKIVEKESRKEYNTITINGRLEIEGQGKFLEVVVDKIKGSTASHLLGDVVRKDSLRKITGTKTFTDLDVTTLTFEKVNDIEASEIVSKDAIVNLNGNISFKNPVNIQSVHLNTGKINGVLLDEEIIDVREKQDGVLEFEKVNITQHFQAQKINNLDIHSKMDNFKTDVDLEDEIDVFIPENITVTNINGENFEDFIHQLCLLNIKCFIPGTVKINGNVIVDNGVVTRYLNNLKFPEEYILRDLTHHSNITGEKIFKGSLTSKEVRCRGTVDGLDTKELVTLSTNQDISGKMIFKDIQVTEALNIREVGASIARFYTEKMLTNYTRCLKLTVTGKILGEHIDQFLPNPTLKSVNHIRSNVNFKILEVDGDIIVDYFNGNNLEQILSDLLYKDEENATITSTKEFPEGFIVRNNFHIQSNSINNIKIDSLVTKDTDQVLDVNFLKGDVTFDNILVNGTYDSLNITQMDQDLVKLTGDQYISSTLIFQGDIEAKHFEITEQLNDKGFDEYLYTDGDREIVNHLAFEAVEVENILVEGDVDGNLVEFDLNDFNERYLSYSKDQVIEAPFFIKHSVVDHLKADYINDQSYDDLFSSKKLSKMVKSLLENEQLKIENLYVNGSIEIQNINDETMEDVLPKNIFIDEHGKMRKNFSIRGNIYLDTVEIEKLSEVTWDRYIKQLIFKDETDPILKSPKIHFTQGVNVYKLIETEKLNTVPLESILIKEGNQDIVGEVVIKGDVTFKDNVVVAKDLNDVDIDLVLKNLSVSDNGTYTILGDILFSKLPHIYGLTTEGFINDKTFSDVLSNLVYTDEDCVLYGEILFTNLVNISGNMAIAQKLNDIKLSKVVSRMVLTTSDTEILGPVSFAKPVLILEHLTIENDLVTDTLYGCNIDDWASDAIFIDQGLIHGNYIIDNVVIGGNLTAKFVNDIDMNRIVPLRSNQTIDHLEFEELIVVHDIPVGNLVNGYNLPEEYNKTVMANLDQEIPSNVVFQNIVIVRENLTALLVNDKEVSKMVTTDTDQNLTAAFNFNSQCRMESDLHIYGLLNEVNASLWMNNGVKLYSPELQNTYDEWIISKNFTFDDTIEGECRIGDLNLVAVMKEIEEKRNYKYQVEYAIIDDYKNMCIDITYLYELAKKQIYKFKYFEDQQTVSLEDGVQNTHYFEHKSNHYLLVNGHNCTSQLLMFNRTLFSLVDSFETGHISQVISVRDGDSLYLVSNENGGGEFCEINGTNVWKFAEDNVMLLYNVEHQDLLQESLVPGTFYTINKKSVIEFKITKENGLRTYRKWKIHEDNTAFVPRGLKTGLALRTGSKVIFLDRTDPLVEDDFGDDTESIIIGNFTQHNNHFLPGRDGGDLVVTRVGTTSTRRNLVAVATHEETSVRGRLDFIKIYENALTGEIFHKVPSYKPSNLVSIEFDQGETLLVFLENERTLQIFEYKGIEGFKHHSSSKVEGSKLFLMTLPVEPYLNERKVIGIVHKNTIRILQSVMLGNQIRSDLKCGL